MKVQNVKESHNTEALPSHSPYPQSDGAHVSQKNLINQINFNHFQDRPVSCTIDHGGPHGQVSLPVIPEPVFGSHFVGLWPESIPEETVKHLTITSVSVPCGHSSVDFEPDVRSINAKGFCIRIPESGCTGFPSLKNDVTFRYDRMQVRINKGGLSVLASIVSMGLNSVTLSLPTDKSDDMPPLTLDDSFNLAFIKNGAILFTGQFIPVSILFMTGCSHVTLRPSSSVIHRIPPKKFRSPRHTLEPAPDAGFVSPFHGGFVSMAVHDLSGSGFSVVCEAPGTALITGMIIHGLTLDFSGAFSICCTAQMVHQCESPGDDGIPKTICGFAFMDMSVDDHLRLSQLVHRKSNPNIRICNRMDENELWSFFFETNFIYAQKYRHFLENKDKIKSTYRKLYSKAPSIARHFTYKENGSIVGHMSMLRTHRDGWLAHHHAALKRSSVKAGLAVLNHLGWFCYNSLWLEACHMKYLMCFYRPENTFPNFFFSGFAQRVNDPTWCSTDLFAYATHRAGNAHGAGLPEGWSLSGCSSKDLNQLKAFYAEQSGGLLIDAMDLSPDFKDDGELFRKYHDAGLIKERRLFSLKHEGLLRAVVVVNISDVAINMSDLTNCVTLFVVDETGMSRARVHEALSCVAHHFDQAHFPALIYPLPFADKIRFNYEKRYQLWILANKHPDQYFQFLDEINALALGAQHRRQS